MTAESRPVKSTGAEKEQNIPTMDRSGRNDRQGSQIGWTKQGIQVPDHLALRFRDDAADLGYGGVKYLGAAALGLVLALSKGEQKALANYVRDKTWNNPGSLEADRLLHMITMFYEKPYNQFPHLLQSSTVDMSYEKAHKIWTKEEKQRREEQIKASEEFHSILQEEARRLSEDANIREDENRLANEELGSILDHFTDEPSPPGRSDGDSKDK